jgi:hypothetical protein
MNKKKILLLIIIISILISVILCSILKPPELFESGAEGEVESAKKYENSLSLVCIFKNESMNLKIWLDHYINQGVDKFYMIDNGSTDNPKEILQSYIDNGLVKYYWRPDDYNQEEKYRTLIKSENLKEKTDWLIICDADEFFYGYPKTLLTTLNEDFSNVDAVLCNWRIYGSDGLDKHPEDITKSIVHRIPHLGLEKYIVKPRAINNLEDVRVHEIYNLHAVKENDKIRLNHYLIQSKEFYEKVKMDRGDVAHPGAVKKHNWDFFKQYDELATLKDDVLANITY